MGLKKETNHERIEIYIGLSVFALSAKSQVKESRPNVIYIIMDDLGYGISVVMVRRK